MPPMDNSKFHKQVVHHKKGEGYDQQYDPIAQMTKERFTRAREWRRQDMIGQFSVEQTLWNCYNQYHSIPEACDADLAERINTDVRISLTKHKVDTLVAWTRDLLGTTNTSPFVVEPTPIPDLSEAAKMQVVAKMRSKILSGYEGTPEQIFEMARQLKAEQLAEEVKIAQNASMHMQKLIDDQLIEGGFRNQIMDFLTNFALYPYAVMVGPMPEMIPVYKWSGNTPRASYKPILRTYNVSPFDYYWSPDTYQAGKGTYDIIRIRMTKMSLLQCAGLNGFIKENVINAVRHFDNPDNSLDWLSQNPDKDKQPIKRWPNDESIDLLVHYGAISGKELRRYGMTGVDDNAFYECQATVLGSWTIRLLLNPNPDMSARPIYSSSYQRAPGKMAGYGIGQIMRDIERSFMAAYRGLIENIGFSAAPIGEVDYTRIQRYMSDEQLGELMSATVIPTDPDMTGGGRPAHYFHNVPNISGQLIGVMQYFTELADRHTGIPAAMSGQPVGTGANRTFRGIMALYGNALKGVQSAMINLDRELFEPLGKSYFAYNMRYSKDPLIKGDAMVRARGTEGLLQKEIDKQNSLENLQMIAQLSQTGQVDPKVLNWAVTKALETSGVPLDELGVSVGEPPSMESMGAGFPPAEMAGAPTEPTPTM